MNQLDILAEEILIKIDGKRTMCKAVLVSDKGGHVVSYLDKDGIELKSQPLYRSPFKDKVKEIKEKKTEQAPKQEQSLSEQVETLRQACETAGLSQQQLAEKYAIPLETLTAWFNDAPPEDYIINLLLRCLAMDFPTTGAEPVLSEQEPVIEQPEPTYTFTDQYGKPLSSELEKIIREEFETGRFDPQQEHEQDFYGEPTAKKSGKRGKLYLCTKPDPDRGLDYGTEFRVIKEG